MAEIGLFEAKTRLSELVRQVKAGESFIITQRGEPVAELSPIRKHERRRGHSISDAIRRIQEMYPIEPASHEQIREWIEDGRE
jgi:prevent-host-death family protein